MDRVHGTCHHQLDATTSRTCCVSCALFTAFASRPAALTCESIPEPWPRNAHGPSCRSVVSAGPLIFLGVRLTCAISGTSGSSGLGSVSMEQIERRTGWLAEPLARQSAVRTLRDGQSRAPLVSQNVEADGSVGVDVGVVDLGGERDLGGLERVVRGEGEGAGVSKLGLQSLGAAKRTGRRHHPSTASRPALSAIAPLRRVIWDGHSQDP